MSHNHAKHEVLIKLDTSAPISKNITCLRPSYSILLEASTSVCKSPLVLEKKPTHFKRFDTICNKIFFCVMNKTLSKYCHGMQLVFANKMLPLGI